MKFARFFALLLLFLGFLPAARGHQVPSVELEFQNLDGQWRLLGEMDIAYMLPEMRNVPGGPPLSRKLAMAAPPEELARYRKETENTLRKLLRIAFAGKDVGWRVEFPDFEKDPLELPPEAGDIALLSTRLIIEAQEGAGELRIFWSGEDETELIILTEQEGEESVVSTLPGGNLMLLKKDASEKAMPVEKPVAGGWLQSGFHHVIYWDHILFILGLFLLVPEWKPLLQQSLLFTLAHSITLALAIFNLVPVSENGVVILIALSIAWIGVENLMSRGLNRWRLGLVFCFGLLHGLGFASVLAAKLDGLGLTGSKLVGPLLGFNIGVELAQISILAGAFVLLWPIKKWTSQVRVVGSVVIAMMGVAWAVQLVFFPQHPLF